MPDVRVRCCRRRSRFGCGRAPRRATHRHSPRPDVLAPPAVSAGLSPLPPRRQALSQPSATGGRRTRSPSPPASAAVPIKAWWSTNNTSPLVVLPPVRHFPARTHRLPLLYDGQGGRLLLGQRLPTTRLRAHPPVTFSRGSTTLSADAVAQGTYPVCPGRTSPLTRRFFAVHGRQADSVWCADTHPDHRRSPLGGGS